MQVTTTDRFVEFADACVRFVEEMSAELPEEADPIEEAQRLAAIVGPITKKWTVPIIYILFQTGELRFSRFRELLMGISSRTLSLRLKELEARGWVRRKVVGERPPGVLYSLTEAGTMVAKMAGPMSLYLRLKELARETDEATSPA
ncbi:MAG: helix-turn-helix domain-containing protein [Thermoplasmata archaeon]|nr:helix-turn-helix domain-containing protein [Thermoplasmata archaeon]